MGKQFQKVNYENLKTGDLVFTTGKGPFSRAIKEVTDSDITHVGFVVQIYKWRFIFEMLSGGLTVSSFKRYTHAKSRDIVKVCRPVELSMGGRQKLRDIILEDFLQQIEYDWKAIAKFIFKRVGRNDKAKLYCSEHAFTRLNSVIRKFPQNATPQISPAELARGLKFQLSQIEWRLK